jgi:hypothetical protein
MQRFIQKEIQVKSVSGVRSIDNSDIPRVVKIISLILSFVVISFFPEPSVSNVRIVAYGVHSIFETLEVKAYGSIEKKNIHADVHWMAIFIIW